MVRRLGLIIGINQYQDTAFRPLQFAETDARALAQWLVNVRGGKWLPSDVQLALGAQATHELVETLITQACLNNAGPGDLVLIYFAGHAFIDQTSGEGHLALANTRGQQPATALHLPSLLRRAMAGSRAAQIVLVLDCFQTGRAWSTRRTTPFDYAPLFEPTLLQGLQQTQGRLLYCSCRGNELAPEVGGKNLGLFLHSMIVGLSVPASDHATEQITLQSLHAFLSSTLDEQHRPQVFGQEQRPIVLVGEATAPAVDARNGQAATSAPSTTSSKAASNFSQAPSTAARLASGPLAEPSMATSSAAATATATVQMSPTTSGQLSLSIVERNRQQQCMMLVDQARQLVRVQNFGEAFQLVERALQIEPNLIDALILKAQLLGASARFQEATATVEQITQLAPNNALAWSMRAALLTNMGELQEARTAIERSIALDPHNPETQSIKNTILANLARTEYAAQNARLSGTSAKKRGGPLSFFMGASLQIFALFMGTAGAALLTIQPQLPIIIAFLLASLALAILCVNAARGSYRYGFTRLLLTLVTSLMAASILGALYRFEYSWLTRKIIANPPLIVSVLFLALWLATAAIAPLLTALGGLVAGIVAGVRRKPLKYAQSAGGYRRGVTLP